MEREEQIFGLIGVADEQQKAVQEALEGLKAERAAVAKERVVLITVANDVRRAAAEGVAAMQRAAGEAVGAEVRRSFGEHLDGVVKAAGEVEDKLSGAVAAFGWRWALLAGGAAAGGIAALLLAAWVTVWWQRGQVEGLAERKAALTEEVAQLQGQANDWAKRGGRAKLDVCGEERRLCVQVDKRLGYGKDADYFVLRGY